MVACGRDRVFNIFNWDKVGSQVLDVYYSIFGGRIKLERYKIKNCLGKGWHFLETNSVREWAWSKKESTLHFPRKHQGFSLDISGMPNNSLNISIYGSKRRLIGNYDVAASKRQIDIPAGESSIKIEVSRLWSPKIALGSNDLRQLGVCLHNISPLNVYRDRCESSPLYF